MLLELAQWLARDVRLFNVFNYITLRAVLACLTALAVSLILGPYVIRKLTAYKIGQAVREEGPRSGGKPRAKRPCCTRGRRRPSRSARRAGGPLDKTVAIIKH